MQRASNYDAHTSTSSRDAKQGERPVGRVGRAPILASGLARGPPESRFVHLAVIVFHDEATAYAVRLARRDDPDGHNVTAIVEHACRSAPRVVSASPVTPRLQCTRTCTRPLLPSSSLPCWQSGLFRPTSLLSSALPPLAASVVIFAVVATQRPHTRRSRCVIACTHFHGSGLVIGLFVRVHVAVVAGMRDHGSAT
ncbi:hypothetical protein HPB50_013831 [Hyalomma asiaticum]|uniref:Uncharacterized protein n=1 Tax=Hyalomma asiaticum TaxID=266040 RepID=A0ACB7TKB8_HYAAI|nr:hypothetical protein HPB50_013831 [Hyalomma asiaticum]